jgi:hypothetical protein
MSRASVVIIKLTGVRTSHVVHYLIDDMTMYMCIHIHISLTA